MSNEKMLTISLVNLDIDCAIEVPVDMFFELLENTPDLIGRFGFESSMSQWLEMLSTVKFEYKDVRNFDWSKANADEEVFLRRCQIVVALGAHLKDIPLMLSGEGLVDFIEDMGGIEVTEQVLNGSLPIENFA